MRCLALLVSLFTFATATADDWSGKFVKPKQAGVKLSRKVGGGLVRDGEALDGKKTYAVKSDDGTFLELERGYILKLEAELAAAPFPKEWKKDAEGEKPSDRWAVNAVVQPTKRTKEIPFGDWVDGKQVFFTLSSNSSYGVRKDNGDGWVRIYDGNREGWVEKTNLVISEGALAFWDKAVKANPKDSYALHMRGSCWFEKGQYDKAITDYSEGIRLEPSDTSHYVSRGLSWYYKREYDKAISDFSEAISLDPKCDSAFHCRGMASHWKGDHDRAISDYTEAIRLDPNSSYYYLERGRMWFDKKEYNKAISDYSEAIRLVPQSAEAYDYRGATWIAKKDYDKAISDFNEAIRLAPESAGLFISRGNTWLVKKDYDKAFSDFREAIRLEPNSSLSHYNQSITRLLVRKPAIRGFQELLKLEGYKGVVSSNAVINGYFAAMLEGDKKSAQAFLEDSKGKLEEAWPYPIVRLLRKELTEADLLKLATDNDKKIQAHCALGYVELIARYKTIAKVHFTWVKNNGDSTFIEYAMAIAELDRLEK